MENLQLKIVEISNDYTNEMGIDTEILANTLYYRLTLMRLGEEDNNIWWESNILGEVGRRNIGKFFPNTFNSQRYNIGRKIIVDKEQREISEKDYISLFNFGYFFETEIFKPFLKEITTKSEWKDVLLDIEKIKDKKFEKPWVRDFYNIPKIPIKELNGENIFELGSIFPEFYKDKKTFHEAIVSFLSVYDLCTVGNITIPYYKKRMKI